MNTASEQLHPAPPPLPAPAAPARSYAEQEITLEAETKASAPVITWPKLTTLLRWLGAVSLIASAMTFLVSNWMETDQLLRYGWFLGFTALLSGCGWFCINRWQDDKGARTFFALGTALLPAHFAMLGAMIYAFQRGVADFGGFREAFQFEALSGPTLLATIGGALALLVPLTYLGFAAMARRHARALTGVFVAANATLLLTVRDANWVAGIGFALLAALIWCDRRFFAPESRLRTWDGIAMRSLLFAPFGLLVGRTLVLHGGGSDLLISLLCTTVACVFYLGLPRCLNERSADARPWIRLVALAPAFLAWTFGASAFGLSHPDWDLALIVMPCALIAAGLSLRLEYLARPVRSLAVAMLIGMALWQLVFHPSLLSSLLTFGVSLATILTAYGMRERWSFRVGIAGFGLGLAYQLRYAAELYQGEWLWVSLGVTGVIVLLTASYLERYGRRGLDAVRALHLRVSAWE